jgi:protein gp37
MSTSSIEWTETTWNPITGCDRVSPGCDNCYALGMAKRLKAMGSEKYQTDGDPRTSGPGFGVAMHSDVLTQPLRWKHPRTVFVNSMADLFHQAVTDDYIAQVFAVMAATPQHTYQILTKRHGRMRSLMGNEDFAAQAMDLSLVVKEVPVGARPHGDTWPLPNVWLGVSVEDQKRADLRIPALLMTCAAVRFLSCEPLLGPVDLTKVAWTGGGGTHLDVVHGRHGVSDVWATQAKHVDWVIVGGESGPGARPMHPVWATSLRDQCRSADVPFFFKQWGEWIPESIASSERGAATALYLEHDGTNRLAVRGARGDAVTVQRLGKHKTGRLLDGRTWDQYPVVAR